MYVLKVCLKVLLKRTAYVHNMRVPPKKQAWSCRFQNGQFTCNNTSQFALSTTSPWIGHAVWHMLPNLKPWKGSKFTKVTFNFERKKHIQFMFSRLQKNYKIKSDKYTRLSPFVFCLMSWNGKRILDGIILTYSNLAVFLIKALKKIAQNPLPSI